MNYTLEYTIQGHVKSISCLSFSPNGLYFASASSNGTIKLYQTMDFKLLKTLVGHEEGISDICWAPHSMELCSCSDDYSIRIWNIKTYECRVLLGHTNHVMSVDYNPQSNLLVSGSFDESIRKSCNFLPFSKIDVCNVGIWDTRNNECIKVLPAHSDPISCVVFNQDGTLIASCSFDGLIRIWDTSTGQCLKTLLKDPSPPVSFVQFAPFGRYILANCLDSTLKLWSFEQGKLVRVYKGHTNVKYCIKSIILEQEILMGTESGTLSVWDLDSTDLINELIVGSSPVLGLAVDSKNNYIAASCIDDLTVKIYKK